MVNRKHHQLILSLKVACGDRDTVMFQSLGSLFIMNSAPSNSLIIHMVIHGIFLSPKPLDFCPHSYPQISCSRAPFPDFGVGLSSFCPPLCLVLFSFGVNCIFSWAHPESSQRSNWCILSLWHLSIPSPHPNWSILYLGKCKKQQTASFMCHFPFKIIFWFSGNL